MSNSKIPAMNECPAVTVIIPTHNRSAMLDRAVRSVLTQTYQDFELIIVSDNSTDGTDVMVASIKDPRIRFFQHESRKGASAARNTGMKEAKGRFIAFLDDDDEWTTDKLAMQVPVLEKSPPETGLVYAWSQYVHNGRLTKRIHDPRLRGDVLFHMLDRQAIGYCSAAVIKRSAVDKVGYFDERLFRGNDGNYLRRISEHYHVDFVPKVLCRIHTGHLDRISIDSRHNLENAIFTLENRLELFAGHFDKYSVKRASVASQIAGLYFQTGKMRQALGVIRTIFKMPVPVGCKIRSLYCAVRMSLVRAVKKLMISCRRAT